jgi:hypothetical protein
MTQPSESDSGIPVEQRNNIQSAQTLSGLLPPLTLNKADDFTTSAAALEVSNGSCGPTYLQNKFQFYNAGGQGRRLPGVGPGTTAQNRRWFTLDTKIQQ